MYLKNIKKIMLKVDKKRLTSHFKLGYIKLRGVSEGFLKKFACPAVF